MKKILKKLKEIQTEKPDIKFCELIDSIVFWSENDILKKYKGNNVFGSLNRDLISNEDFLLAIEKYQKIKIK
jgi:hypothetical protein